MVEKRYIFLEDDLRVSRITGCWSFSKCEETFLIRILSQEGDLAHVSENLCPVFHLRVDQADWLRSMMFFPFPVHYW